MKIEIKELRKIQKRLEEAKYPGYPFHLNVVVDCENGKCWVGYYGKDIDYKKCLEKISGSLLFEALNCDESTTKGNWLRDTKMADFKDYLLMDRDNFYIDNVNAVRFYFALNSAMLNNLGKGSFIFACVDNDYDWVTCKVFETLEEIKKFKKEFFGL